ncbi:MAG: DNA starvation/stationary phase protection protein [Flavobacteriales bacterium]|nr:DNA starvation/stationary phase protection protein [Bacteroidota bacterium]MCB9241320.1 DNA starvation/stationary phase protection protein [Flavobacteriales bacterium]
MTTSNTNQKEIISLLNQLLASYQIYYQNMRGYHWNIKGKKFFELHLKFEEYYTDAALRIDEIAERILTIGATPLHTFTDFLKHTKIEEHQNVMDGDTAVAQIKSQLTRLIDLQRSLLTAAETSSDAGTADLATRFIAEQEKTRWMLDSYLS